MSSIEKATEPTKPIQSENLAPLFEALAKAQGEFPVIPKDTEVKVYSKPPNRTLLYTYFYADLTTIIQHTRPALAKHGLSFTQDYRAKPLVGSGIVTIIHHESGAEIESGFVPVEINSQDMKLVAGQFTYAKRISLSAALAVSADEDVDAAAMDAEQGKSTVKTQPMNEMRPPGEQPWPDDDGFHESRTNPKGRWDQLTEKPKSKLDQLRDLVKAKGIPYEAMPDMIFRSTGSHKRSTELTDLEIEKVMKYLNLLTDKGGAHGN